MFGRVRMEYVLMHFCNCMFVTAWWGEFGILAEPLLLAHPQPWQLCLCRCTVDIQEDVSHPEDVSLEVLVPKAFCPSATSCRHPQRSRHNPGSSLGTAAFAAAWFRTAIWMANGTAARLHVLRAS